MQPRSLAFLAFAMLTLHVPGATAAPAPDTVARSLGDAVTITFTQDPAAQAGDVLPFCTDAPDVPNNHTLTGTIQDDCFQPYTYNAPSGPLNICDPVIINTYPVAVVPDEECIENLGEWIIRVVTGVIPAQVGIRLQ